MTTTEITTFETSHGPVELSVSTIKDLFCPNATDSEAAMFLKVCQYQGLNPFLRDAYLIKYDTKAAASIVIGKDFFTKRADTIPGYDGVRAGIVVMRKEQVVQTEGALPLPGDKLIGGWAEVTRKDRSTPTVARVDMAEYNANQSSWKRMPATMIRKVAIVQALREAFPSQFQGLYDEAEMMQSYKPDQKEVDYITGEIIADEVTGEVYEAPDLGVYEEWMTTCPKHSTEWSEGRAFGDKPPSKYHRLPDEEVTGNRKNCTLNRVTSDEAIRIMDTSQMVSEWMADNRNGMAWDYLTNEEQLMALLVMLVARWDGVEEAPEEEPSVDEQGAF